MNEYIEIPDFKIIEEKHLFTSEEKLKFCGYGEWVEEADYVKIESQGYTAVLRRIFEIESFSLDQSYFGGYLCGYVRIPESHPCFRKEDINLECHGGLTFNEAHEEQWVGFDCSHFCDIVPTTQHIMKTNPEFQKIRGMLQIPEEMKPVYRNMKYCVNECLDMIDQLIKIAEARLGNYND